METIALMTEADTVAAGANAATVANPGSVVALVGQLGAGKTHWTKGFVAALDCPAPVSSPTFTLVHEYEGGRLSVFHFDFYRLESRDELLNLGWDDYLDRGGVVIAEWADRFPELLPEGTLWVHLSHRPEGGRHLSTSTTWEDDDPANH